MMAGSYTGFSGGGGGQRRVSGTPANVVRETQPYPCMLPRKKTVMSKKYLHGMCAFSKKKPVNFTRVCDICSKV